MYIPGGGWNLGKTVYKREREKVMIKIFYPPIANFG